MWGTRLARATVGAVGAAGVLVIATGSPAPAAYRAVMVGPNYPGGDPFDDTIAAERMTAYRTQFAKWGNWKAADIALLTGAVTQKQITDAITNANVAANDVFVFAYHGHGSYTNAPKKGGNNVGDPEDELYALPPLNNAAGFMSDDALATALAALPATSIKVVINVSCYGGGFADDLTGLNRYAFMAAGGETQTIPEIPTAKGEVQFNGQPFFTKLYAKADPANLAAVDKNKDNKISIREYYDASAVAGSVFAHRWLEDFDAETQNDFDSVYGESLSPVGGETLFEFGPTAVPAPSGLLMAGVGVAGLLGYARRVRSRAPGTGGGRDRPGPASPRTPLPGGG